MVIGLLAILAAITIVAVNPAKSFSQSRNTQRWSHVRAVHNAVEQWLVKEEVNSALLDGDGSPVEACGVGYSRIFDEPTTNDGEVDLDGYLVSEYIVAIPRDPLEANGGDTGYSICRFSDPLKYKIVADHAELGEVIEVPPTSP